MKIGFHARFRDENWKDIYNEEKLNDAFLIFLPRKLEIAPLKKEGYNSSKRYDVRMETGSLFTMEEIKEKLAKLNIKMDEISHIRREFTKEELEEVKKLVCFKEIFQPTETVQK